MHVARSIWDPILSNFHQFMARLVQSRISTAWNNMIGNETMDIGEMFEYIIDSSVMDVYDDIAEYSLNPFYQPWGFICQILTPFVRFFWQVFGKSPIFRFFLCLLPMWVLRWVYQDYYRYLAVGRGGTPPTFGGWMRNKFLIFFCRVIFRVDVLSDPFLDPMTQPYRGRLFDLAPREGERPTILGLEPQRQSTQVVHPDTQAAMIAILEQTAAANPENLVVQQSLVEPHLRELQRRLPEGLWRLTRLIGLEPATPNTIAEWGGVISHVHPSDSSAHIVLHPADAAEVIQKGWAERPPLACTAENRIWRFWHHTFRGQRLPLPYNMVLVYAPRNAAELEMFRTIVDAATWWATLPDPAQDAPEDAAEDVPASAGNSPSPAASEFGTAREGDATTQNGDTPLLDGGGDPTVPNNTPVLNGDGLGLNGDGNAATPAALRTPVLNGDAPDGDAPDGAAATPAENA